MNPKVDAYIDRSNKWPAEMRALRSILKDCGLTEEMKWGKPCYVHEGTNIAIMQEMNAFLALMFFRGALLKDPGKLLFEQGPNTRLARRMQFTSVGEIDRLGKVIKAYVTDAVRVEADGVQGPPASKLVLVDELQQRLERDKRLGAAFEALTPGRQREYNLHISSAKQSATRVARIAKCAGKILEGKGFRE